MNSVHQSFNPEKNLAGMSEALRLKVLNFLYNYKTEREQGRDGPSDVQTLRHFNGDTRLYQFVKLWIRCRTLEELGFDVFNFMPQHSGPNLNQSDIHSRYIPAMGQLPLSQSHVEVQQPGEQVAVSELLEALPRRTQHDGSVRLQGRRKPETLHFTQNQQRLPNDNSFSATGSLSAQQRQRWEALLSDGNQSLTFQAIIPDFHAAQRLYAEFQQLNDSGESLQPIADFPQDAAGQVLLVKEIYDAMFDFRQVMDGKRKTKRRRTNEPEASQEALIVEENDNCHVRRVRNLKAVEGEMLAWRILFAVRDAQLGNISIGPWSADYGHEKNFQAFRARLDKVLDALRASKAITAGLLGADLTRRLAAHPDKELKRKSSNKAQNADRDVQVKVGNHFFQQNQVIIDEDGVKDTAGNVIEAKRDRPQTLIERTKLIQERGRKRIRKSHHGGLREASDEAEDRPAAQSSSNNLASLEPHATMQSLDTSTRAAPLSRPSPRTSPTIGLTSDPTQQNLISQFLFDAPAVNTGAALTGNNSLSAVSTQPTVSISPVFDDIPMMPLLASPLVGRFSSSNSPGMAAGVTGFPPSTIPDPIHGGPGRQSGRDNMPPPPLQRRSGFGNTPLNPSVTPRSVPSHRAQGPVTQCLPAHSETRSDMETQISNQTPQFSMQLNADDQISQLGGFDMLNPRFGPSDSGDNRQTPNSSHNPQLRGGHGYSPSNRSCFSGLSTMENSPGLRQSQVQGEFTPDALTNLDMPLLPKASMVDFDIPFDLSDDAFSDFDFSSINFSLSAEGDEANQGSSFTD